VEGITPKKTIMSREESRKPRLIGRRKAFGRRKTVVKENVQTSNKKRIARHERSLLSVKGGREEVNRGREKSDPHKESASVRRGKKGPSHLRKESYCGRRGEEPKNWGRGNIRDKKRARKDPKITHSRAGENPLQKKSRDKIDSKSVREKLNFEGRSISTN